jgi:UDP-N-acetylmuramyl-tripeptide synthetase
MALLRVPHQLTSVAEALAWLNQHDIRGLTADSRRVTAGDVFIAWPGHAVDARQFVGPALQSGASACLVEAQGAAAFGLDDARIAALPNLKTHTGDIASSFFGHPSRALRVLAVTGTNGKTSTSWWLAQALAALGQRCAVVGTLGVGEPLKGELLQTGLLQTGLLQTGLTTPDPITLQSSFKRLLNAGVQACAVEASSIGLVEQRLSGTHIDTALFTNFTQDHLDFHGDMAAYWLAKAQLFSWRDLRAAVVNVDDAQGAALAQELQEKLVLWTYSMAGAPSRLRATHINHTQAGLSFTVHEGELQAAVRTQLIGTYNVANLLAVLGALRAGGVGLAQAASVCAQLSPVPGRMQRVGEFKNVCQVVVDYAHTPDALEQALRALRSFATERGGKLWCVFGCGGNRDASKRPLMGAVAQQWADHVVLTSDNPRQEDPTDILRQVASGCTQLPALIENRRTAIQHAVHQAQAVDVILIAGKGHETYQDIRGVKHHFSDLEEALQALQTITTS